MTFLNQLALPQQPGQSLSEYFRSKRQAFDDLNDSCVFADGSSASMPEHFLALFLLLDGLSSDAEYAYAKTCAINEFALTNRILSPDEVMESILRHAQNFGDKPGAPKSGSGYRDHAASLAGGGRGRNH
jgi:hypothetical protein